MSGRVVVDIDVPVDLDALWAGMAAKLEARDVKSAESLAVAERLFWRELTASDDWIEVTTSGEELALVTRLRPAFERRFIAKALRELGRVYVRGV